MHLYPFLVRVLGFSKRFASLSISLYLSPGLSSRDTLRCIMAPDALSFFETFRFAPQPSALHLIRPPFLSNAVSAHVLSRVLLRPYSPTPMHKLNSNPLVLCSSCARLVLVLCALTIRVCVLILAVPRTRATSRVRARVSLFSSYPRARFRCCAFTWLLS